MITPNCGYCGTRRINGLCPRCATPADIDAHFRAVLAAPAAKLSWWDRFVLWLGGR